MKVLVGLSGGVDSAVAASYLIEAGYEVGGAYMRMCDGGGKMSDSTDARKVADLLQIPFYELFLLILHLIRTPMHKRCIHLSHCKCTQDLPR